mmetsp:Transcript_26018/g.47570  ORF Transcript_26018/g.47570 Transcript_26018/m.47570 type:complete len:98 (+) Transcript_26018:260-553(+)
MSSSGKGDEVAVIAVEKGGKTPVSKTAPEGKKGRGADEGKRPGKSVNASRSVSLGPSLTGKKENGRLPCLEDPKRSAESKQHRERRASSTSSIVLSL